MRTWVEPALAEEAVFERMRALTDAGSPLAAAWNRERETLYAEPTERRASAFTACATRWFESLECLAPLRAALAQTPHVAAGVGELHLRRAARRSQEGSELYRDGPQARLVFGLTPRRFAEPPTLEGFFLRECLYAEDMLDPTVGYVPELGVEQGDLARTDLVRDRLRVLWAARVHGRLARLGREPVEDGPPATFRRAFGVALQELELERLHGRVTRGELATFPEWLEFARS